MIGVTALQVFVANLPAYRHEIENWKVVSSVVMAFVKCCCVLLNESSEISCLVICSLWIVYVEGCCARKEMKISVKLLYLGVTHRVVRSPGQVISGG
jgi:hypothetical protein